jgi:hypothetical protein
MNTAVSALDQNNPIFSYEEKQHLLSEIYLCVAAFSYFMILPVFSYKETHQITY